MYEKQFSSISLESFESFIDVLEKMTATAEFMESFEKAYEQHSKIHQIIDQKLA